MTDSKPVVVGSSPTVPANNGDLQDLFEGIENILIRWQNTNVQVGVLGPCGTGIDWFDLSEEQLLSAALKLCDALDSEYGSEEN